MGSMDYLELANGACDRGEYEQAIDVYSRVIEIGEHLLEAYTSRAFAYAKLGNWESAIDDYTSGIAQCDDGSTMVWQFYSYRAYVFTKMNSYEAAVDDYTKAIKLFIENPEIFSIEKWDEEGIMLSAEHELTDKEINTLRVLYSERSEAYRQLRRLDLAEADEEEMLRLNNKTLNTDIVLSNEF